MPRTKVLGIFRAAPLQRLQKRHQVGLLLHGQVQIETLVVKFHRIIQCGGAAIMEIGRASR